MTEQNEKLNLCFFINGFGEGGAERQCAYLINELKKDENIIISLIYFFEGENFKLVNQTNINLYKIPSDSQYSFKNISLINSIVGQIAPDIIFSWMRSPDVFSSFVKFRFPHIKWILAERNSRYRHWWNFRFLLRVSVGRFADAIICNSTGGEIYWKKRLIPSKKIIVIPNILYTQKFNHQNGIPVITGDPVILFAGRLWYQKNVFVLTAAFCKLADKYKNGKFYIIGEGQLKEEVKKIITKYGKEQQVILMPYQSEIFKFFSAADVFVNISLYEGLPNTIIENTILNKKMVVSALPAHLHVLGPDFPYYVKNINDVDLVCRTIEAALGDNNFTSHLQHAKKFIEGLQPDTITNQYKKVFYYVKENRKTDFTRLKEEVQTV